MALSEAVELANTINHTSASKDPVILSEAGKQAM